MKTLKTITVAAAALLTLSGCEKEIEFNGRYSGEKLVLYACANPDTVLTADLFKSAFFLGYDDGNFYQNMDGATVSATLDGVTYPMLYDAESEKFVSSLRPRTGDRIGIRASMEGFATASAEVNVPSRPFFKLTSCTYSEADYELHFRVVLRDNPGRGDYYRIRIVHREGEYLSEMSTLSKDVLFLSIGEEALIDRVEGEMEVLLEGCIDDGMFEGDSCSFDIWTYAYPQGFYYGESGDDDGVVDPTGYGVQIDRVSESLYRYTKSLEAWYRSDDGFGSVFGEPVCISNNIKGGLGCFGALSPSVVMWEE